jgi:tRNA (uracil-5-)-methyltransferase TRM9
MPLKAVTEVTIDIDPATYETQNVHAIYDTIASHFSSTRYKVMDLGLPRLATPS